METKARVAGGPVRPSGQRASNAVSLTPKEMFGILRRHVLLIIILTILGFAVGGASWYFLRQYLPRYTAKTFIEVLPAVETDPMTIVAAQVQKDIQYGYRVSMASLIKQQSTLQELLRQDKVKATKWFAGRDRDIRKAVKYLQRYMNAYAHRDADYVEVSMTCGDAKETADIVNEMVRLFIASQGGTKRNELSEKLARLEERRARVEAEVAAAYRALDDVRTAWDITDLERPANQSVQHIITLRLNALELQENELVLAVRQVQANIENLRELATGPIAEQIEQAVEGDPVMVVLAQQLAFQEAQLSARLSKFGENHRVVRQARELVNEIRERRLQRKAEMAEQTRRANLENGRDTLIVMQERLAELQRIREQAAAKKRDLDMARVQYEQRQKIRDERIETLNAIKVQVEKFRIMINDPETPKVQPVGLAPEPLEMTSSRQWWLWFPGGTTLGCLFGLGFAFLIEMANDLVRTPKDVARFLHVALLGVIPDESEDDQAHDIDLCQAVHQAPYSLIGESYRRFRTNLELSSTAESVKALLITSGGAGEGSTSVAVNLAEAFVAEGKKVLLIDANFRRPSLQTLFPRTQANNSRIEHGNSGLSTLLTGKCGYKEAIRSSGITGFDLIDSGTMPSNPAELLSSRRMAELITEQRKNYNHIVVDSPPVLLVSDTKVLARLVDESILVLNAAATRRGAAQRAIFELREVGVKIAGCVLFAAQAMKGGYFREQFKSYRKYQTQLAGAT